MSRVLDEEGIDRSFTFEGSVIFITNIDFSREVARGNKMAPHYDALMSRSTYVDLGIHNKREVLVRIKQVSHSAEFLSNNGITSEQADVMINWLSKHVTQLRTLSIRTALQLASLLKTDSEWEEMAEVIMLK